MNVEATVAVPQPDPVLAADAARELTDSIRARVAQVWDLVRQAYLGRAWEVLGHVSWDAYCAAEFDGAQLRIPREERQEVVASLREIGMSSRAIASATGLARGTVLKELEQVAQIEPPDQVVGLDGKVYQPKPVGREPDFIDNATEGQPAPPKAAPALRRKPPITESFDTARGELLTKANTLAKLAVDARFDRHAEQLSHRFRSDLLRARDALQAVIDRLPDLSDRPEEG
ncbi:hypothetical protein [Nocardia tengchongensis]|uniref:hypothetical protein n=1 Tax=Nocardia tengchongensis TaxID=2055889 RepID=UPI00368159A0